MKRRLQLYVLATGMFVIVTTLITWFSVYHSNHMTEGNFTYPAFLYSVAILALLLGGMITYVFEERIEKSKRETLLSMLPRRERKIMEILIDRGEIEQNKLSSMTDLSKVKVSRTLSALEERGVIDKKKHGYTNLVILDSALR